MALLRQTALMVAVLGVVFVSADFHTDVIMRGQTAPGALKKATSFFGDLRRRRLDEHEDMSPEDQEKMGKCMTGDCAAKFQAVDEGGGEAICEAVACAKDDENCAPIMKMMETSPDMPKGLIGCFCDAGCTADESTMAKPADMCTFYKCTQDNADQCGPMLEGKDFEGMVGMAGCFCSSDNMKTFFGAMMDMKSSPCKDMLKGGRLRRRLDAHGDDEEDDGDELDICKVSKSPDSECAKMIVPAYRAIQSEASCSKMKDEMNKDVKEEDQKCIDELLAAVPEPTAAPVEAAADGATNLAAPGLTGLLFAAFAVAH